VIVATAIKSWLAKVLSRERAVAQPQGRGRLRQDQNAATESAVPTSTQCFIVTMVYKDLSCLVLEI